MIRYRRAMHRTAMDYFGTDPDSLTAEQSRSLASLMALEQIDPTPRLF